MYVRRRLIVVEHHNSWAFFKKKEKEKKKSQQRNNNNTKKLDGEGKDKNDNNKSHIPNIWHTQNQSSWICTETGDSGTHTDSII